MVYDKLEALESFVADGLCSKRKHPTLPIWIYNYTARTQYEFGADTWPEPLRDARGLVLDAEGRIVARGFRKFFNLEQLQSPPAGLPEVWEKLDGSLIIAFQYEGQVVCATRGSFISEQACFAEKYLKRTVPDWTPPVGQTFCFEAIFPSNRIVVDYGKREELVFLSALDTEGCDIARWVWHGSIPSAKYYGTLPPDQLPFSTEEGFVLRWPCSTRAKVKMAEYKALHRIIFGVSSRAIWEALRTGSDPLAQIDKMTPPLADWTRQYCDALKRKFEDMAGCALAEFAVAKASNYTNRAEFAAIAKKSARPNLLFALLDGKPINDMIWKAIEPPFERPACAVEPEE